MAKKKTASSAVKEKKSNEILVNVVLDRSGSMGSIRQPTIDGYNEYLNGLRGDKDSNYNITLIQFDTGGGSAEGMLTVSYVDKPLAEVPNLNTETYEPRGGTPLYDAIGECIRRVDAKGRGVFTVIITDGHENASQEFTKDAIKKLITEKEAQGWKFVFLGANIDAMAVGMGLGISTDTTAIYAANATGVRNAFATMSASNRRYASATRSHGVGSLQATMSATFTGAERSAMADSGGVGSKPATFHPRTTPPTKPVSRSDAKRRNWKTVSSSK